MSDHLERIRSALAGRYTVERELGAGGMATVYLAEDPRHERKVAVKVLRPDLAAALGAERFLREIKISASLTHPNILTLIDSGEAGGFLYYVMPYIEGESLRDRLAGGELPVGEAVTILREVADALAHAHEHAIVHRDIKPDNVMLSGRHALVMDFGVAKAVSEAQGSQDLTVSGSSLGTPTYMAPEQASGDPDVDHRADLYSLGAMAYEMLCGRPPFTGGNVQSVMAAHVTKTPEPVTRYRPAVSPALEGVVMRCLEKHPADRWQHATDLVGQLEALGTPSGGFTTVSTGATTPDRHAPRPVQVLMYFALASIAIVALAYGAMMQLGLPGWVLPATIAVMAAGIPVMLFTAHLERSRALTAATGSIPAPATGLRGWLNWRRAILGGGGALGALATGVVVYMAMRLLGIGPVGTLVASGVLEQRERIVLATFVNRTTDTTLGETVTELLRIDLAQSPTVTVLEPAQVNVVLNRMERTGETLTPELATEVAVREGIKAIVGGEILPVGTGFVVSSRLTAASSGATLWADRETAASADQIVTAVDALSASLRERVGESLRSIRADPPLDRVTTGSTEALRKYAQANRANDLGDPQRAIALLEEAIAADSSFAMAHRKLGVLIANRGGVNDRAREAFTHAWNGRDRLTERERWLAEAAYRSYIANDVQGAIDAYESLLERYPTDPIALNNLAVQYTSVSRREEAEALYIRSIRQGAAPAATYTNAVAAQFRLGKTDSVALLLDEFGEQYPRNPAVLWNRAAFASAQFRYDAAERHLDELQAMVRGTPTWDAQLSFERSNLRLTVGQVQEALAAWTEGFETQAENGLGWVNLPRAVAETHFRAWIQLLMFDDPDGAVRALDRVLADGALEALTPLDRDYLRFAAVYAQAGRVDQARQLLRRYEQLVDSADQAVPFRRGTVESLRGLIAAAEGRFDDAIAALRRYREVHRGCELCGLTELGEAYSRAGQLDSAVATFERYLETPDLFRVGNDSFGRWYALRRLGELYESLGDDRRAADYYSQFVDLWEMADPELQPLVAEARRRIARLVGEPSG